MKQYRRDKFHPHNYRPSGVAFRDSLAVAKGLPFQRFYAYFALIRIRYSMFYLNKPLFESWRYAFRGFENSWILNFNLFNSQVCQDQKFNIDLNIRKALSFLGSSIIKMIASNYQQHY